MAQSGFTPILIYGSGTTGNTPTAGNLTTSASGAELAINYFDGKLFYKDNAGVVQVLATKATGSIGGSNTQVQYNSSGALAGSANMTFNGTTLSVNGLTVSGTSTLSALTASTALALNASKEVVSVTNTGSGDNVLATSPTLVTPVLGAATATSLNGLTVSSTTGTLTLANGSTLATSGANALTLTTTGATNVTLPTSGTLATTAGTVASFSAGSTGFTPSTATTGAVTLAGTLATTNGGTGLTSFTSGGVVYASSTSALATGSALTFDGSTLGVSRGTAGTAASFAAGGQTLKIYGDSTSVSVGAGGSLAYGTTSTFYDPTNLAQIYLINNSEQMRLTSTGLEVKQSQLIGYSSYAGIGTNGLAVAGNVGIGTSSPSNTMGPGLHIATASGNSLILEKSTGAAMQFRSDATTIRASISGINGADGLTFSTGAAQTERMRIDSSGNLGLGVTPSAWGSGSTALQIGNGAIWKSGSRSVDWITNGYYNGSNYIYNISNAATYYRQFDGVHSWYTAPSGTAGNAISFTQAMTLDASGRLGVGETSPDARISVKDSASLLGTFNSTNASAGYIQFQSSGANFGYLGSGASLSTANATDFTIRAQNALTFTSGGATERARISSDGTFRVKGAGTAGSTDAFQVSGSAPADAARITSGGELLVGTTSAGTMSGGSVIGVGARGGIITNSAGAVANGGTLDIAINTAGGGYQGFLAVANTVEGGAASRTQTTFSVFGRGTDSSIQQIATDNGTTGAATFTVTTPSDGVIRVTNTSGNTTTITIQFFGGTSF